MRFVEADEVLVRVIVCEGKRGLITRPCSRSVYRRVCVNEGCLEARRKLRSTDGDVRRLRSAHILRRRSGSMTSRGDAQRARRGPGREEAAVNWTKPKSRVPRRIETFLRLNTLAVFSAEIHRAKLGSEI